MRLGMEFLRVPAQSFEVGWRREERARCLEEWRPRLEEGEFIRLLALLQAPLKLTRVRSFAMSRYPVTHAQYRLFVLETGARVPEALRVLGNEDHPLWGVEISEARDFARWASIKQNVDLRLPTDAEWEVAARGPERRLYPYGQEFDARKANTFESGWRKSTAIDRFIEHASPYGIADLSGNIEEWVEEGRLRGGSFRHRGAWAQGASVRDARPGERLAGFRLVYSL